VRDATPWRVKNAINYAKHRSRSDQAVIRVYDASGNVVLDARAQGRFQNVERGKQKAATPIKA
jgi:hypothetical protein